MPKSGSVVALVKQRNLTGMVILKPLHFLRLCLPIAFGKADIEEPVVNVRTFKSVRNFLFQNRSGFPQSVQLNQDLRCGKTTLLNRRTVPDVSLGLDERLVQLAGINIDSSQIAMENRVAWELSDKQFSNLLSLLQVFSDVGAYKFDE